MPSPYHVSYDHCTDVEPRPGWYEHIEHDDGREEFRYLGMTKPEPEGVDW